jgi:hypothetical protein
VPRVFGQNLPKVLFAVDQKVAKILAVDGRSTICHLLAGQELTYCDLHINKRGKTDMYPKLLLVAAAGALLTGAAACGSSSSGSSSSSAPKASASATSISGTESFSGSQTGKAAVASNAAISLTYTGPVQTTGTFNGGGNGPTKGQHYTFKTAAGNFAVVVAAKPVMVQHFSASTCYFSQTITVPYTVDGAAGTGKFAGATGSGKVVVTFAAYGPKLASGKCNPSNNAQPLAKGAHDSFLGSGPLTVKS